MVNLLFQQQKIDWQQLYWLFIWGLKAFLEVSSYFEHLLKFLI